MLPVVMTDTSFWIALLNQNDQHHLHAQNLYANFSRYHLVSPWPILYEVLRTKLVKTPANVKKFDYLMDRYQIERLDDAPYRSEAYRKTIASALKSPPRPLSLVDSVIRIILLDEPRKFHFLFTYNEKDFLDVCHRKRIEINDPNTESSD